VVARRRRGYEQTVNEGERRCCEVLLDAGRLTELDAFVRERGARPEDPPWKRPKPPGRR